MLKIKFVVAIQSYKIILAFIIVHVYYKKCLFLPMILGYCLVFDFNLKDSLKPFLKSRSNGNWLNQLLFFWKYLKLSFIFKNTFARYTILCWQTFPFSVLNISTFCLLISEFSNEKLTNNLRDALVVPFSFCFQAFFFFCL